jgi:hypothetical protein
VLKNLLNNLPDGWIYPALLVLMGWAFGFIVFGGKF